MNRIAFWLLLLPISGFGQSLGQAIDSYTAKHPEAVLAVSVYNLSSNKSAFQYQSALNLSPASSLKLLTTMAALELLGKDFRFETKLYYTGKIEGGVLNGNLVIVPSGDPSFGSSYFNTPSAQEAVFDPWIAAVKKLGIEKLSGKIMVDLSQWTTERIPPKWIWEDMGNYFGAPVSPFNLFDNMVSLYFSSENQAGKPTQIEAIQPEIPDIQFVNEVLSADNKRDEAYVFAAPGQMQRVIRGTIPMGMSRFKVKASMPNAELFAAQFLTGKLREAGVEIPSGAVSFAEAETGGRTLLYTHYSPALADIIKQTNINSLNLYAECLLRAIALKKTGVADREKGIEALNSYYENKIPEIQLANIEDGSGLSRYNGVSADFFIGLLKHGYKLPDFQVFYNSLPVSGKSGSIAGFHKGTVAENNLRAKSGYLDKVRSYTGYVKNQKGEMLAFSVMVNNYNGAAGETRDALELILLAIANLP